MTSKCQMAICGDGFANASIWIGGLAFAVSMIALYRWLSRQAKA